MADAIARCGTRDTNSVPSDEGRECVGQSTPEVAGPSRLDLDNFAKSAIFVLTHWLQLARQGTEGTGGEYVRKCL